MRTLFSFAKIGVNGTGLYASHLASTPRPDDAEEVELATGAMRVHSAGSGTDRDPIERYDRHAPLMMIGEDSSEIQRCVIARGLLAGGDRRH